LLTVDNVVASPHPGHIDTTSVVELWIEVSLLLLLGMLVFFLSASRFGEFLVVVVVVVFVVVVVVAVVTCR